MSREISVKLRDKNDLITIIASLIQIGLINNFVHDKDLKDLIAHLSIQMTETLTVEEIKEIQDQINKIKK
ncbi:hypothetical protein ACP8H2_09360 [Bacillus subtilis]|uniref:hypothetical protein n=1 Tax=Bacillus subtilis TaxID=1423 RepID=UPI003CE8ECD4